jgi:sigma-B regulation protein RsbU (phosphoserine phosphatase)
MSKTRLTSVFPPLLFPAILLLAAWVDWAAGPGFAGVLYVLPVALAGWCWGWFAGIGLALAAAALNLATELASHGAGTVFELAVAESELLFILLMTGALSAALGRQQQVVLEQRDRLARLNSHLEAELRAARALQNVLSGPPPEHAAMEAGAHLEPARILGGDMVDLALSPGGRLAIAVTDVSGKGSQAALAGAVLVGLLDDAPARFRSPAETLRYLNMRLAPRLPDEMFATMFYGLLDLEAGTLAYAIAGHEPPFLLGASRQVQPLTAAGPALGILPGATYDEETVVLQPGDLLLCYTDGIIDRIRPVDRDQAEQWLRAEVAARTHLPCQELVEAVVRRAAADAPVVLDDITLVAVRYRGAAGAGN